MKRNPVRRACSQPHECPVDVRVEALARCNLTNVLSKEDRRALDTHLFAQGWAGDDALYLEGEDAQGVYILVAGRVRIVRDTANGRQITIDIAGPGDILGTLDVGGVAGESAWAMETSCTLFLPSQALARVVDEFPGLSLSIIRLQQKNLAHSRAREVAQTVANADQRVAATLQYLDNKFGSTRADGSRLLQVRLLRDDIAGIAGTTVETASRCLARFKAGGVIDSGREWISILKPDRLAAIAKH